MAAFSAARFLIRICRRAAGNQGDPKHAEDSFEIYRSVTGALEATERATRQRDGTKVIKRLHCDGIVLDCVGRQLQYALIVLDVACRGLITHRCYTSDLM